MFANLHKVSTINIDIKNYLFNEYQLTVFGHTYEGLAWCPSRGRWSEARGSFHLWSWCGTSWWACHWNASGRYAPTSDAQRFLPKRSSEELAIWRRSLASSLWCLFQKTTRPVKTWGQFLNALAPKFVPQTPQNGKFHQTNLAFETSKGASKCPNGQHIIVFVWSQFDGGKIDNRTILTGK